VSSMSAASFIVGQSDWLPMMIPTLISAMLNLPHHSGRRYYSQAHRGDKQVWVRVIEC